MTDPMWHRGQSRRVFGSVTFAVLAVVWLLYIAAASLGTTWGGTEYKCIVDGPHDARAYPMEASPVSADFIMWPLGRECVWPTAVPNETVVAHTDDWGPTIVMVGLAATSIAGLALAAIPVRPARRRP